MNTDIADDRELQFLVTNRRNAFLRNCRIRDITWQEDGASMGYMITADLELVKLLAHSKAEGAREGNGV